MNGTVISRGLCTTATIAIVAALSMTDVAMAQDSDPAGDARQEASTPEIIVTAQKRAQRLNDVGISIVTATADQLATAGVNEPQALAKIASGFTAARTISGYQVFSIRGVNFNSTQISAAPTVSSYVDEAALPYSSMTGGLLLDVDHIEVLKGPQGTLFGQNATGGSINVISAKPTDHFAAGLNADLNNFGEVRLGGHLSGPLSDTVRARLAFETTQFGAWQKGYFMGIKNGDQDRSAARLLVDWDASDRLKISININGNVDKGEPQAMQLLMPDPQSIPGAAPGLLTYPLPPHSNRAAEINTPQRNNSWLYQGVLRADYELNDNLTFTSISNYIDNHYEALIDDDATALLIARDHHISTAKSFGQEIRLTGKIDSPKINYILGANYQHDKFAERDITELPGYSSLPGTIFNTHFKEENRAAAVFGNIDVELLQGFTVTGGVRYTETKQSSRGCSSDDGDGSLNGFAGFVSNLIRGAIGLPATDAFVGSACATMNNIPDTPGGLPSFLPIEFNGSQKEHNVSWRAGINYKPTPDTLLYALVSRGYKSGGYPFQNTVIVSQVHAVAQEELTDFEAGAKFDLFDRALSLDFSAFYYKYNNKQFFSYVIVPFIGAAPTSLNIPKSKVKGFDMGFTLRPVTGLTARGGLTFIDTKIGNYTGVSIEGDTVDFTGKRFNFAPKVSANADVQYEFPIASNLDARIGGSMLYNSTTFGDLANSDLARIPAYTTFDARVGLASEKGWNMSLWVRNLTDKYYWTSTGVGSDSLFKFTGQPRTAGVSVGFTF